MQAWFHEQPTRQVSLRNPALSPKVPSAGSAPVDWEPSLAFLKLAIGVLLGGAACFFTLLAYYGQFATPRSALVLFVAAVAALSGVLLAQGRRRAAVFTLCFGAWTHATLASFLTGGVSSVAVIIYPVLIALAGWLIGMRAGFALAALSVGWTLFLTFVESWGWLPSAPTTHPPMRWLVYGIAFTLMAALVGYLSVAYDAQLAQGRALARELTERGAQLAATFGAIPDLLFELDLDGNIHAFHSPQAGLLAAPPAALIGARIDDFIPPQAAEVGRMAMREALDSGFSRGRQYSLDLPQGKRWFELSVARKPVAAAEPARFVVLARDVTERVEAAATIERLNASLEERVRERTAQLEDANRELESFSYTISHDLRAPLRSMVGFSGLLREALGDRASSEEGDYLKRISASGNRMSELIDAVLEYSRLGRSAAQRVTVDLDLLVAEVAAELGATYPQAQVRVLPLGSAEVDPVMARQIFTNLIGNALKYSAGAPQPLVEVGANTDAAPREFYVRDNGIGFDMAHAEHIFELFTRLESGPGFDSTGAGLAIVKRLVERHGGRIRACARPGEGAAFFFTLDAAPQEARA
ncbi:MAG: PAS domain-containing protein [Burkholderiales bacterium]|nr:PAS domain-containing protein [Burkholderiales bacterium]